MSNSRSYKAWSVPLIAGVLALGGIPALAGTAAAAAPKSVHDIKDDFNGDGKQDLVLFRGGRSPGDDPLVTKATVWRGPMSRAGKPAATQDFGSTKVEPYDVMYAAAGDVNGDGRDDLALTVYVGDG